MAKKRKITLAALNKSLKLRPDNCRLEWREGAPMFGRPVGGERGLTLTVDGVTMTYGFAVYCLHHQRIPNNPVVFINKNPTDVRLDNLQEKVPSTQRGKISFTPQQLSLLEGKIIKPGFDKHLIPLLAYRGPAGEGALGQMHRYWNFTQAMMLQEVPTVQDGLYRFHRNPDFSHLCGPSAKYISKMGLVGFFNRLLLTRAVHTLDPDLVDYVRSLEFFQYELQPVDKVSSIERRAFWRTFNPQKGKPQYKGNVKPQTTTLVYPFLIHDAGKPEHKLLRMVNNLVPKGIDPDLRADICQDILVGILSGEISEGAIEPHIKSVIAAARKVNQRRYQDLSFDAPMYGNDSRSVGDTISYEEAEWL